MKGMVAVTGATGFLGRYIVRSLAQQGWRVRILARAYPVHEQFRGLTFEAVTGDLSDPEALSALARGADVVIHAAGLVKARDARAFTAVNVEGTANLIAALNASDTPARLILVSSMAAREPHLSSYAATKRGAEEIVRNQLADRHEWIIVRPAAIYGPWDVETLSVLRAVQYRIAPRPGRRSARVSLAHAADVAAAITALCRHGPSGGVFEITDARHQGYLWDEITGAAARAMGVRPVNLPVPALAVRLMGAWGSSLARLAGATPMLTMEKTREILHPDWGSRPEWQLPPHIWRPEIGIIGGFSETVAWYRAHGWLPKERTAGG